MFDSLENSSTITFFIPKNNEKIHVPKKALQSVIFALFNKPIKISTTHNCKADDESFVPFACLSKKVKSYSKTSFAFARTLKVSKKKYSFSFLKFQWRTVRWATGARGPSATTSAAGASRRAGATSWGRRGTVARSVRRRRSGSPAKISTPADDGRGIFRSKVRLSRLINAVLWCIRLLYRYPGRKLIVNWIKVFSAEIVIQK